MTGTIDARLADLGITLPQPKPPAANYIPFVRTGNLLFVSGQVSAGPDGLITGLLTGADAQNPERMAEAAAAARTCGLSLIAHARAAAGDLDHVVRVVKLLGFVNATSDFGQAPVVINGCSDLMVEVFGEAGRHARSALGVSALPFGVMVEVEAIFELA
jgi:enamine deaminase RidA (YjgF/YER057c/UK114 family)